MELTDGERGRLEDVGSRIDRLKIFLVSHPTPGVQDPAADWLRFLDAIKRIVGNANNDLGFVSTLLAKQYLGERFEMRPFDAAEKPQGAPGLDLDERTVTNERVIGEIKTTTPYLGDRLGAAQLSSFRKDLDKLERELADHKFFFVTHPSTYEIAVALLRGRLPEVEVVQLAGVREGA